MKTLATETQKQGGLEYPKAPEVLLFQTDRVPYLFRWSQGVELWKYLLSPEGTNGNSRGRSEGMWREAHGNESVRDSTLEGLNQRWADDV